MRVPSGNSTSVLINYQYPYFPLLMTICQSEIRVLLRLVFTSDGVVVGIVVGVIRVVTTYWKSKIRVVSVVISPTESESEESERFHFFRFRFTTPSLMIQWRLDCRSQRQKRKNQPITRLRIKHCDWFILPLQLATLRMRCSLACKQRSHMQMRCSAPSVWFSLATCIALRFWFRLRLRLRC